MYTNRLLLKVLVAAMATACAPTTGDSSNNDAPTVIVPGEAPGDEEVTAADVDLVGEGDGDGSARAGDIEITGEQQSCSRGRRLHRESSQRPLRRSGAARLRWPDAGVT